MVEMEKTIKENKDDLETLRLAKNMALAIQLYSCFMGHERLIKLEPSPKISFQFIRWLDTCAGILNPNTLFSIQLMMVKWIT